MDSLRRTGKDHDDYRSFMRELYHQNMENSHAQNLSQTYSDPSTSGTTSIEEPHSGMLFNPYSSYQPMLNSMNSWIPEISNNMDDFSQILDADNEMLASLSLKDNLPSQGSFNNHNPIFETDPFSMMNANEAVSNFPRYVNDAVPLTSRVHPYEQELQILQMRRIEEERYIRMQRERNYQLLKGINPYIDPSLESCMQHCYDPYRPSYLDNAIMQPYPQLMVPRSSRPNLTRPQRFSSSFLTDQAPHVPKSYSRRKFMSSSSGMMNPFYDSRSVQMRYTTIDEVTGKIYRLSKDQHGCRFLQRKFTDGSLEDKNKIFSELIEHIVELTTDPFGNYLVQRMAEVCDENQRMQMIDAFTNNKGTIIEVSCNMHGTRVIQKVIETLKKPEQACKIILALRDDIVLLMKDNNGNHVAQCCLKRFLHEQNDFILDAAIQNCVELATDRQGCCVLQKCIVHSNDDQRTRLLTRIASYSFVLSQDPYANYLVQFLLAQKIPWVTAAVLKELKGNYGYMSMLKHGSPVVEVCFVYCQEDDVAKIIREIMTSPRFLHILQNAYGNFVVQKALAWSRGGLRASLLDAIRSHTPAIRHHPYGRKVLQSLGSRRR